MGPIKLSFLWLFAAIAAYEDLRYRKVPNWLILCASAGGVIICACGGWTDLRNGLTGFFLGLVLLLPAFTLQMVGGGDVKSLAVIGLFTGPELLWVSFLRGAAAGGLLALPLLAARRLRRPEGSTGGRPRISPARAGVWTLPYAGILALCAAASALWA